MKNLEALSERFWGDLISVGDPGYEDARRVWNGNIDRRPALVARCRGVADVRHAVSFAGEEGLLVSLRGGGHSIPGYGTNDGGLVIDLSAMKGIRLDPDARTARAEGGVLWREFDRETQEFGLATTGGTVSNTGIAGLTLGGGLGWLMGKHGLTVDNLISADVVTADAEFHSVSADREPDLDRKSTRLNSSHPSISYAVFCLKKKKKQQHDASHVRKYTANHLHQQ